MNLYQSATFRGFNTDVNTRRGGYNPGTIGVSRIQGKVLNYSAPALQPLQQGAGVSVMRNRPVSATILITASILALQNRSCTQICIVTKVYVDKI
jgi:hypothetical protein